MAEAGANCSLCNRKLTEPSLFYEDYFNHLELLEQVRVARGHYLRMYAIVSVKNSPCNHLFHAICIIKYRDACVYYKNRQYGKFISLMICPSLWEPCSATFSSPQELVRHMPANTLSIDGNVYKVGQKPFRGKVVTMPSLYAKPKKYKGVVAQRLGRKSKETTANAMNMIREKVDADEASGGWEGEKTKNSKRSRVEETVTSSSSPLSSSNVAAAFSLRDMDVVDNEEEEDGYGEEEEESKENTRPIVDSVGKVMHYGVGENGCAGCQGDGNGGNREGSGDFEWMNDFVGSYDWGNDLVQEAIDTSDLHETFENWDRILLRESF